jgi:hypothetical protein
MQEKIDAKCVQFGKEADKVLKAAAEPIDRPSHHHSELALSGIPAERIKGGALIAALGVDEVRILLVADRRLQRQRLLGDLQHLAHPLKRYAKLPLLTPREERVLCMRFGIGMNGDHTLTEVGQQFSLTRERIRQIEGQGAKESEAPESIKLTQELPQ